MHGGWGYAEEYPISRYVVDATVLPIFEGVKPILGERIPFWFVSPWREWATVNPVEGDFPNVKPLVRLSYELARKDK